MKISKIINYRIGSTSYIRLTYFAGMVGWNQILNIAGAKCIKSMLIPENKLMEEIYVRKNS